MTIVETPKNMRTFTTIWIGQLISLLGSGLTSFALGVWIYSQTGKATPFAITVLFGSLPPILLAPLVGSVADRFSRKKIILLADTGAALITLAAFWLYTNGQLQIWNIYLIALLGSTFSAFQEPAFAASIVMLVPKKDLQRANGMANMASALGGLISPILGGLLVAIIGLDGIMMIDFITYFAALFTMLFSHLPMPIRSEDEQTGGGWKTAMAGWHYLRVHSGLLKLIIFFAVVNFMLNFASVLTGPLVLSTASSEALGMVYSIGSLGMLLGSILLSSWGGPKRNKIRTILIFTILNGLGLGLTGIHSSPIVIAIGFFVMLFFVPLVSGTSQAIFQLLVPPDLQGRVFAMRSMISRSIMPLAFLTAGPLADRVFEPLMQVNGALGRSWIANLIGAGAGRGIGLLFLLCMLGELAAIAWAWSNKSLRALDFDGLPQVTVGEELVTSLAHASLLRDGQQSPGEL